MMLFKGNSSRLELLIEKIQSNKENHEGSTRDIVKGICYIYYFNILVNQ